MREMEDFLKAAESGGMGSDFPAPVGDVRPPFRPIKPLTFCTKTYAVCMASQDDDEDMSAFDVDASELAGANNGKSGGSAAESFFPFATPSADDIEKYRTELDYDEGSDDDDDGGLGDSYAPEDDFLGGGADMDGGNVRYPTCPI
jgi:hypothetical protein